MCLHFLFFFKQKTAYEMRISDWSSDVCSSDLKPHPEPLGGPGRPECALADQSSRGNAVGRVHGRAGAERIGFLGAGAVEHALSPDPVEKAADRTLQLAASVAVVGFEDQPLGFFVDRKSKRLNSSH